MSRVQVCPDCGSRNLRPKTTTQNGGRREHDEDWYCQNCSTHVDPDLVPESEAHSQKSGVGPSEDAQRLLDANPADLGLSPTTEAEDDDLRADGRGGSQPGTRRDQTAEYVGIRKGVVRSCGRCSHTLIGDADGPCPNCGSDGDA